MWTNLRKYKSLPQYADWQLYHQEAMEQYKGYINICLNGKLLKGTMGKVQDIISFTKTNISFHI
jgi:hypothetical protein